MQSDEPPVPLTGGNLSEGLVRIGHTVRRPAGPWSPSVHAFLRHLDDVGFTGAPRSLGFDEQGTTPDWARACGTSRTRPTASCRERLLAFLPRRAMGMYELLARGHASGTQPWARLWAQGHGAVWRAKADYAVTHLETLRTACR